MQKEESTLEQTKKVFLTACKAKKEFLLAQEEEKRKTLQNLLWNVSIQNQKLASVSFKPEFQPIANEPNLDDFDKLRASRVKYPRYTSIVRVFERSVNGWI